MGKLIFKVQGSQDSPYTVEIIQNQDESISVKCDCKAGIFYKACKHRNRILHGDTVDIVSDNTDDLSTVKDWVKISGLAEFLETVVALEKEAEAIKKKIKNKKNEIDKRLKPV